MNSFDAIAPFYDLEHESLTFDTTMYAGMAKSAGKSGVLVLGCGTGRIIRACAAPGRAVTGLDSSEVMLSRAKGNVAACPGVTLLRADMRTARLGQRFGLIIVPLDTFSLLPTQQDQIATLETCAAHLAPGGMLVIDQTNPLTLPDSDQNGLWHPRFDSVHAGVSVTAEDCAHVDLAAQTMNMRLRYHVSENDTDSRVIDSELSIRWVYRFELDALIAAAGLRTIDVWGDYERGPYRDESPRMLVIAGAA